MPIDLDGQRTAEDTDSSDMSDSDELARRFSREEDEWGWTAYQKALRAVAGELRNGTVVDVESLTRKLLPTSPHPWSAKLADFSEEGSEYTSDEASVIGDDEYDACVSSSEQGDENVLPLTADVEAQSQLQKLLDVRENARKFKMARLARIKKKQQALERKKQEIMCHMKQERRKAKEQLKQQRKVNAPLRRSAEFMLNYFQPKPPQRDPLTVSSDDEAKENRIVIGTANVDEQMPVERLQSPIELDQPTTSKAAMMKRENERRQTMALAPKSLKANTPEKPKIIPKTVKHRQLDIASYFVRQSKPDSLPEN